MKKYNYARLVAPFGAREIRACRWTFLTVLYLLTAQLSFGQKVKHTFFNEIEGPEVLKGASFMVSDDRYRDPEAMAEITKTTSIKGYVALGLNNDSRFVAKDAFVCQASLQIDQWNKNGDSTTVFEDLVITFDPSGTADFEAVDKLEINAAHEFRVTILDIKTVSKENPDALVPLPQMLKVFGYLEAQRVLTLDCNNISKFQQLSLLNSQRLRIEWAAIDGAEEYELEWTFYDALSFYAQAGVEIEQPLEDWFRDNATRIVTSATNYELPLIYPDGYLLFRVRGAATSEQGDFRLVTNWAPEGGLTKLSSYPVLYQLNEPHAQHLNWQSKTVFAEDAKNAQTVTYADGLPRARQEVTLSRADDVVIVKDMIYDAHGRMAVQVLPTPAVHKDQFTNVLDFVSEYARNDAGQPYSYKDFDLGDQCEGFNVAQMNNGYGSSYYYSGKNHLANNPLTPHRFIPDAQMYPFAVTEFTPDATGRVKRQSGIGPYFLNNGKHDTHYYYGKAAQPELDRLFLTDDVGNAKHYQKNMVKDPNGQLSVSYVDPSGRTIATGLTGASPKNLVALKPPTSSSFTVDLLNNIVREYSVISTYNLLIAENGEHIFTYNADVPNYTEDCLNDSCYTCIYDVEISVTNNCGSQEPLKVGYSTNSTTPPSVGSCLNGPGSLATDIGVYLEPGEYTVSKRLTLSLNALEYYAEQYKLSDCMPDLQEITDEFLTQVDLNCDQFSCAYCDSTRRADPTLYLTIQADCAEMCDPSGSCEIFYYTLLADVSPGGQYMTTTGANGADGCNVPVFTDPTSMFYVDATDPNTPAYKHPITPYKDVNGVDAIVLIDGMEFKPEELDVCKFLQHWQPSWATSLVENHPEYCLYEKCITQSASQEHDEYLLGLSNFPNPLNPNLDIAILANDPFFAAGGGGAGQYNAMSNWLNNFTTGNGNSYSLLQAIIAHVKCFNNLDTCNFTFASLCNDDQVLVWNMFRSAYMGQKAIYFENYILDSNNPGCPCLDDIELGMSIVINSTPNCNAYNNKIRRWRRNEVALQGTISIPVLQNEAIAALNFECLSRWEDVVDGWIEKLENEGCVAITTTPNFPMAQFRLDLKEIFMATCRPGHPYGAMDVPDPNSNPNVTPPIPVTTHNSVREALMAAFLAAGVTIDINDCNATCNDLFITFPGSWEKPQGMGEAQTLYKKFDDGVCVCDKFDTYTKCWNSANPPVGFAIFLDYLNSFSDIKLTQAELNSLLNSCDSSNNNCSVFEMGLPIPPQLMCNICTPVVTISQISTQYKTITCTGPFNAKLWAAYLNRRFGLNYTAEEYDAAIAQLSNVIGKECNDGFVMCPRTFIPPQPESDCVEEQREILINAAKDAYEAEVNALIEEFKRNYIAHCLQPTETFTTVTSSPEQQFTLYYYDRAGYLVQTVPPQGVELYSPSSHSLKTTYRFDCFGNAVERNTPDGGTTTSWFDYLGRPVATQDARQKNLGLYSYTIYDGLGRPIEAGEVEHTVAMDNGIARDPNPNQANNAFKVWLDGAISRKDVTRTFYDASPMDWSNNGHANMTDLRQDNLRKRVASVFFMDTYLPSVIAGNIPANSTDPLYAYNYATHYSYDIAGNVKTLVQDLRDLSGFGPNRFKRVDYEYDLVSGKVNKVLYQKEAIDQFIHQYTYDANNRLIKTETTVENMAGTPEIDAEYEYYLHGPLARTVTGHRQVQGTDFAYTLQGWIKGVNASAMNAFQDGAEIPEYLYIHDDPIPSGTYRARTAIISHGKVRAGSNVEFRAGKYISLEQGGFEAELGATFDAIIDPSIINPNSDEIVDMGRDGVVGEQRSHIARDALSYTIGYFKEDYRKISENNTPDFEISKNYGGFYSNTPGLFNGNIRHIAQQVKTLTASAFNYRYDQLQRLKEMNYWSRTNGAWAESDAYREKVNYDRNGNILKYVRAAGDANGNAVGMDALSYKYVPGKNLLDHVTDGQSNNNAFPNDIDNQNPGNYVYDGAGNLVADNSNGNSKTFTWSMYGKVKHIGVTNEVALIYEYDAMQKRVRKIYITPNDAATQTFYVRDAQGNTLATYHVKNEEVTLRELEIYGSGRLGAFRPNHLIYNNELGQNGKPIPVSYQGKKEYELANHLGNVLAVIRDEKDPVYLGNDPNAIQYYEPRVSSAREYYPFGMQMPNRKSPNYLNTTYRYAFNSKESDDEAGYGDDGLQDYGMRMYLPALGRFISVDPIANQYPELTPYQFASNTPIQGIDLDGLELLNTILKRAAKTGLKKATKEVIEKEIKDRLVNYASKNWAKQLMKDADDAFTLAEDSWWEIAGETLLECVPYLGPAYSVADFAKEQKNLYDKLDRIKQKVDKYTKRIDDVAGSFSEAYGEGGKKITKANAQLRSKLKLKSGDNMQAHHVIPGELFRDNSEVGDFVKAAVAGGFDFNGGENGSALPNTFHNGSHPKYNNLMKDKIKDLAKGNYTPEQAADMLRALSKGTQETLSKAVKDKKVGKINDIKF